MGDYKTERLDAILDDIVELKSDYNSLQQSMLIKIALALTEAMQQNNLAALRGLTAEISGLDIRVNQLIEAVIVQVANSD
ncbi:hypothetical protein HF888_16510 (plasmid) [Bermanella marisrubri]|uniref:hypothetical protein n=1 Tax=Bermanella marisrubri TaxID=207949 RepID=UPI001442C8D9|nr:hypothetical protein [Bermanella marisrubri]QIZ85942.1 hypothetical protein HF888_16510 [Bermanella marisrubri]